MNNKMTKKEYLNRNFIEPLKAVGDVLYNQFYGFEAEAYVAFRESGSDEVIAFIATCVKSNDDFSINRYREAAPVLNANAKLLNLLTPTDDKGAQAWRAKCRSLIAQRRAAKSTKSTKPTKLTKTTKTAKAPVKNTPTYTAGNQGARARALFERAWSDVASVFPEFAVNEPFVSRLLTFMNSVKSLGICRHKRQFGGPQAFEIRLSKKFVELDDQQVLDVLAHELIHTMPNCFNHGPAFKHASNVMNTMMNNYNVMTHVPSSVFKQITATDDNYGVLVCACGCEITVSKHTKAWVNPERRVCKKHRATLRRAF